MPGAGEQVEGRDYRITRKDEKLSILSIKDNREVALYDLGENTVLTTKPTHEDKQYWGKSLKNSHYLTKNKMSNFPNYPSTRHPT
jgi:hypothetical protein